MTYLLYVAGLLAIEFEGSGAGAVCEAVRLAVEAGYHAPAVCLLTVAI